VATQVVRNYENTSSTDKLPVCLPVLGRAAKTSVSYQTIFVGDFSKRSYRRVMDVDRPVDGEVAALMGGKKVHACGRKLALNCPFVSQTCRGVKRRLCSRFARAGSQAAKVCNTLESRYSQIGWKFMLTV
jgi:hypothetical protein